MLLGWINCRCAEDVNGRIEWRTLVALIGVVKFDASGRPAAFRPMSCDNGEAIARYAK
jgi:hypothetical protein